MSRIAKRGPLLLQGTGALVVKLTVPAGHKYELVDWSCSSFGAAGVAYIVLGDTATATLDFIDERPIPAGVFAVHSLWSCGVLLALDTLQTLFIGGAGTNAIFTIHYIDVTL